MPKLLYWKFHWMHDDPCCIIILCMHKQKLQEFPDVCYLVLNILFHYAGDNDYDIVNEVFSFSPEGDSMQCLNISIIDDEEVENTEIFTLLFTISEDYNSRFLIDRPATVTILDNDEQMTTDDNANAMAIGLSMSVVFFLFVLVMAGSASCLVMALLRGQRYE